MSEAAAALDAAASLAAGKGAPWRRRPRGSARRTYPRSRTQVRVCWQRLHKAALKGGDLERARRATQTTTAAEKCRLG